jgi:hypothetical protein
VVRFERARYKCMRANEPTMKKKKMQMREAKRVTQFI